MSERLMEAVLKTVALQGAGGSNPSLSAKENVRRAFDPAGTLLRISVLYVEKYPRGCKGLPC